MFILRVRKKREKSQAHHVGVVESGTDEEEEEEQTVEVGAAALFVYLRLLAYSFAINKSVYS